MVRLADLVRRDGPLSERQLAQVRRWLDEDWESHDVDREAVRLISRLVATVGSRRSSVCPCTILEEPCKPQCTCKTPELSGGCLCCATYGSPQQRAAAAKAVITRLATGKAHGKAGR